MIDHYTECLEERKTAKSEPVTVCQLLDNAQQVLQQISKQNDVIFITVICLIVLVSSFTLSKLMAIIQDRLAPGWVCVCRLNLNMHNSCTTSRVWSELAFIRQCFNILQFHNLFQSIFRVAWHNGKFNLVGAKDYAILSLTLACCPSLPPGTHTTEFLSISLSHNSIPINTFMYILSLLCARESYNWHTGKLTVGGILERKLSKLFLCFVIQILLMVHISPFKWIIKLEFHRKSTPVGDYFVSAIYYWIELSSHLSRGHNSAVTIHKCQN